MREIALKHKSANQGLHAFYRRIHGNWYKLLNLRVPGTLDSGEVDSDAHIVATEKGNLQVFENSGQVGKKYVYELNTRHGK